MTDTKWRIGKSFAKYSKQASASLDPSRKSLVIGGRAAGSVSEDDARLIAERIEGAAFDGASLSIGAASDSEETLSAILALAAALLRDEGRIHRWRGELVDVQRPEGGPRIAVLERSAFRLLGLLTVAVHMNGVTPDGRIWTSQRSDTKDINPGKWDNLAAGMVAAGETPLDAMKREAAEEAGLTPEDYELVPETVFLTSRPTESGWMLERAYCYTARLRDGVTPHNVDGEVQATELLDADAMAELIARGKVTSEASLAALHWLAAKTGKTLPEGFYQAFV